MCDVRVASRVYRDHRGFLLPHYELFYFAQRRQVILAFFVGNVGRICLQLEALIVRTDIAEVWLLPEAALLQSLQARRSAATQFNLSIKFESGACFKMFRRFESSLFYLSIYASSFPSK
ncbi:unnamed protein product [Ixodes persulcatus]